MTDAEAEEYIEKVRKKVPVIRGSGPESKFTCGVTRMFLEEEGLENDGKTINDLQSSLRVTASNEYTDNFTQNLEYTEDKGKTRKKLSSKELIGMFNWQIQQAVNKERNEVDSMEFSGQSDYDIVKIDTFEQAHQYYDYTWEEQPWCLTETK